MPIIRDRKQINSTHRRQEVGNITIMKQKTTKRICSLFFYLFIITYNTHYVYIISSSTF